MTVHRARWAFMLTLGLTATLGSPASETPAHAAPPSSSVIRDGHARFEVLTPTLIRLEYAADDDFEDGPTMTAVNRSFPVPSFSTSVEGGARVVRTTAMVLRYQQGSGPFSTQNLSVDISLPGGPTVAHPSWAAGSNPENLGGWRRALDQEIGPVAVHQGLLSRAGWYLLDDTQTVVLTQAAPGFAVRAAHAGAYMDGYLFGYGHDYTTGLVDLRALTGPAPLLPRKAFGVWFSRYWAYTEQDYHALLAAFRANLVPLDTLSVDTDWKRESNPLYTAFASVAAGGGPTQAFAWNGWEWNTTIFPDPARFVSWAHEQGLALALNIHSSISSDDPQYAATSTRAGGLTPRQCSINVADPQAKCYFFDWANPRQLDAYFALHAPLEAGGVDNWWLDWCCDASTANAPGLSADTWINSQYAARNAARDSRWLVLSRIGGDLAGGDGSVGDNGAGAFAEHRSAIHFTGDTCATWPMLAFEAQLTAEEGNLGLPYVSHDIGSFNGVPIDGQCQPTGRRGHLPDDLYVRWVQFGTFQPLDRLHSDHGDRLPWEYSQPANAAAADFLRLREQLVPYLYIAARQAYDTGLPMTRSLYLAWPELQDAYAYPSEYLLGNDMLVAPVTSPGDPAPTTVWIPPGVWIDYFTHQRVSGPAVAHLDVPLGQYPVFVRAGAIIPTQPAQPMTTAAGPQDPMILEVWPGASGSTQFYDDQGQGLAYQRGASSFTQIRADTPLPGCSRLTIAPQRGQFPGELQTRSWEVRVDDVARPTAVSIDGRAATGWSYDEAARTLSVSTGERPTNAATVVTAGTSDACARLGATLAASTAPSATPNTNPGRGPLGAPLAALGLVALGVFRGRRRRMGNLRPAARR